MKTKKGQGPYREDRYTPAWVDAVAGWARRQPVPEGVTPNRYVDSLVALQFETRGEDVPRSRVYLGRVRESKVVFQYSEGATVLFEPVERSPYICTVCRAYPVEIIREHFSNNKFTFTFGTCIQFPLGLLEMVPSPRYPAWQGERWL